MRRIHPGTAVLCLAIALVAAAITVVDGATVMPPVAHHGHNHEHRHEGGAKEHACIHDEPDHQAAIARDLARNSHILQVRNHDQERAFQAQAPESMRFVLSTVDLTTAGQFCSAAGESRPDFKGATVTCAADDVLTSAKLTLLTGTILPQAISRLSSRIHVNRYTSNLVTSGSCSSHTIPASHSTTGVANADYVLYVAAGPITGSTLAWAGSCQNDQSTGRPITGRANFDPEHLSYTTAAELEGLIDTATHEILHALGISGTYFSASGRSTSTTKRGKPVTELNSVMSTLLAEARSYTGCPTLTGVEIEDEGSSGSAGSHFERRLYKDEIMCAAGGSKLSRFSLLALQDLNMSYTIDTSSAEEMTWGKNTGCGFHTEKCNTVAGGAGTYFCFEAASGVQGCTYDKGAVGTCTVGTYGADLPTYFQYYSGEPTKGGTSTFMDACPYYQGYSNRNCTDAAYDASSSDYVYGYTYATDARCFDVVNLIRSGFSPATSGSRCLQARCTGGTSVEFKVNGSAYQTCPSDGASVSSIPGYSGSVTCPTAAVMCATYPTATTPAPATPAPATPTTVATPTTTTAAPTPTATAAPTPTTTAAPTPTTAAPTPPATGSAACDTSYLLTGNSPSPVLSIESINGILTEHNNARRTVSPAAASMPMLTWDQELANFAQEYMDTCVGMVHSSSAMRSNASRFGFSYVGENLAAGTSSTSYGLANGGKSSTAAWNGEMVDWTYPMTCASGKVCGHYTQVIWAATTKVGCGYANCPSLTYKNYWSCVYGSGGNYVGQNPYVQASGQTVAPCQVTSGNPTPTPMPPTPPYTAAGSTLPASPATTTTAAVPATTLTPVTSNAATLIPGTSIPPTTGGGAAFTTGAGTLPPGATVTNFPTVVVPSTTNASGNATGGGNSSNVTATPIPTPSLIPPPPAPTPAASQRMIDGFVRIAGTVFDRFLSNATRREQLRVAVRADIARLLDIDATTIIIVYMSLGSLRVNFTVTEAAATMPRAQSTIAASVAELDARVSTAAVSAAWLQNTSLLYGTESTETLAVTSATSSQAIAIPVTPVPTTPPSPGGGGNPTPASSPSAETDGCGAACVGFYVVIIAAVILVVGAIVVVAVKVSTKNAAESAAKKAPPTDDGGYNDDQYHHGGQASGTHHSSKPY